ncbi:hypothetical protein [uncultured Psychrobacter sp.]|nr:hypothetical protein [uncultured Psychrobacter sp.]
MAACTVLLQAAQFSIVYCFLKTSEHRAAFYNLPRHQKPLKAACAIVNPI